MEIEPRTNNLNPAEDEVSSNFQNQGFALGSLQSLSQTVRGIEQKLRRQDELVRQRISQQVRFNKLASSLISATEELNDLADSLVANAAATTTAHAIAALTLPMTLTALAWISSHFSPVFLCILAPAHGSCRNL